MLQQLGKDRQPSGREDNPYPSADPYGVGGQRELIAAAVSLVIRQLPVIVAIAVAVFAAAILYVWLTPSMYTARAVITVEQRQAPFRRTFEETRELRENTESHMEALQSDEVAQDAMKTLGLLDDPEFLEPVGDPIARLVGFVSGLVLGSESEGPFDPERAALNTFENRLSVTRVGPTVFAVSFTSPDPQRAAQVANAVVASYEEYQRKLAFEKARASGGWLEERLAELRDQVAAAERAVVEYRVEHNIVEASGDLISDQQLAELNRQLAAARAEKEAAQARLRTIREIIARGDAEGRVTEALGNEVLSELRQELVSLTSRERTLSTRLGPNHASIRQLQTEIREVRQAMLDELGRIAQTYASDAEVAGLREQAIEESLNRTVAQTQLTDEAQVELRALESAARSYRSLYDAFLQQYNETVQQQSFPPVDIRMVAPASVPVSPSHPQVWLILGIAAAGGVGLGTGVGLLRELLDRVVRTAGQIETLWGVECLAVLPLIKDKPGKNSEDGRVSRASTSNRMLHYITDEPFSRYAEGIRSIKLALDLASGRGTSNVVGLTSSVPDEGKSTVSANFANLLAQTGRRTLLIDTDLRNPSLTRSLAPHAEIGVIEVLSGEARSTEAIRTDFAPLDFLPAVMSVPVRHTNEIVGSQAMRELITRLRDNYDCIVMDLPPLAPIIDARTAVTLVDSVVFVVEWGQTTIDVINQALSGAKIRQDQLLGMVLNKVDMTALGRIEQYGGKYYTNDKYYARYGID